MKYLMITLSLLLLFSGCKWSQPLPQDVVGVDYNVLQYMMSTDDAYQYMWGGLMTNREAAPLEFDEFGNPIPNQRYKVQPVYFVDGRELWLSMAALHDHNVEPLARYAEAYLTLGGLGEVTIYIVWNNEVVAQQTASGPYNEKGDEVDGRKPGEIHLIWDERL